AGPRCVEGFQNAFSMAAVRTLGSGKCRRARSRATGWRHPRCGRAEDKGSDRWPGAADRTGVTARKERSPGPVRDPGLSASRHCIRTDNRWSVADVDALPEATAIRQVDPHLAPAAIVNRTVEVVLVPVMMVMPLPA